MCNTLNDQNAQSCKYCGYIFENFNTNLLDAATSSSNISPPASFSTQLPLSESTTISTQSEGTTSSFSTIPAAQSTISTGTPLYVVSRSIFTALLPALHYLLVFTFLGFISFSISSVLYLAFFIVIALVPTLFSPRRYEFYDNSLKVHKIVGGDTEHSYSDMTLYGVRGIGRRSQITLVVTGKRGATVIPGNPINQELGKDLYQFLETKLKKYNPKPEASMAPDQEVQQSASMEEEEEEGRNVSDNADNNTTMT